MKVTMSSSGSDSEQSDRFAPLVYLVGIVVTISAITLGVVLHWVAALAGSMPGLFGIDAWIGAFVSLLVIVIGVWAWRAGLATVSNGVRVAGTVVAVGLFSASMLGAQPVLTWSWDVTCSTERPEVCYHLGQARDSGDDEFGARRAYETACRAAHIDSCRALLERDGPKELLDTACRQILQNCADDDSAVEPEHCGQLEERCNDARFTRRDNDEVVVSQ